VLFPGGVLPLKVFEQRYIDMVKTCLAQETQFGVCMIIQGEEVLGTEGADGLRFAGIGTTARITRWDMPQLGILHIAAQGGERFRIERHSVERSGLIVAEVVPIAPEPKVALASSQQPMARLVELIGGRVGPENFPAPPDYDDASWVGYRLAEYLPLPLAARQHMLEINDAGVRLSVLQKFLVEQKLL
jgi:Lon protease-like protein